MTTRSSLRSPAMSSATPLSEQLRRGDVLTPLCPSREILNHLTSRWGVLVLIALLSGTQRFSQLRRRIGGVSERMLAQTLQFLERDGIVERHAYEIVPPHVEYALTPLGKDAATKVRDLADWVEDHYVEVLSRQKVFASEKCR
ncbi:winged helix-turn-helix transcriptional regulator [Pseudomonas sp. B392_1p]|uniref:winged helix-turn-helix transcriptional regulator n=1 Tax=Pseudomonas sp. B392_1p TaxID=3457507 RepID=UPI003FD1DFCB